MQGLELAERYFNHYGMPMLHHKFHEYAPRIAAGLVGDGSECFGFDDQISRDHDWGPSFCLWLTQEDYQDIGVQLQKEIDNLPKTFAGYGPRLVSEFGDNRVGVFEIGSFYRKFIGLDRVPTKMSEWFRIPEEALAVCTNGRVFADPLGEFTSIRQGLKDFYPEDLRLKKIAARCMSVGQFGQYNLMRCAKRSELVAAAYSEAKFCADVLSLVFLLNREYKPFYKWMHRAVRSLPVLGEFVYATMSDLVTAKDYEEKFMLIEKICASVIAELQRQDLSDSESDFLLDHGPEVQQRIESPDIRNLDVLVG